MDRKTQYFTSNETWRGGFYEIEVELGAPSDERLSLALEKLWSHPSLDGCYLDRTQEPSMQMRISPHQHWNEGHLHGIAQLPNGLRCACGTYICRLQDDAGVPFCDYVGFYLPLGALSIAYPVGGYPFSDIEQACIWRPELDNWLQKLGCFVYEHVRFELALVGFEVDFPSVSSKLIRQHGIPSERYDSYLWPVNNKLEWHPATDCTIIRKNS